MHHFYISVLLNSFWFYFRIESSGHLGLNDLLLLCEVRMISLAHAHAADFDCSKRKKGIRKRIGNEYI